MLVLVLIVAGLFVSVIVLVEKPAAFIIPGVPGKNLTKAAGVCEMLVAVTIAVNADTGDGTLILVMGTFN